MLIKHAAAEMILKPSVAAGKDTIKVSPGASEPYKVSFVPTFSGVHTGTITFTNAETGQYVWFTLECHVSDPPEVGDIEVEAVVRTAVELQVRLEELPVRVVCKGLLAGMHWETGVSPWMAIQTGQNGDP